MGLDQLLLTLLTSHFQYKNVGFYYLIHDWMQVVHSKFVKYWENQYRAPLCLEEAWNFQRFLYSQSGLHRWLTWRLVKVIELQNANHLLSLCSYFSPCNIISHHYLFLFRWFTTVDSLSLQRVAMTKLKTWTQQKRSLKGRNLKLVNLFCRHWMVLKGVLLWWAMVEILKVCCYKIIKPLQS